MSRRSLVRGYFITLCTWLHSALKRSCSSTESPWNSSANSADPNELTDAEPGELSESFSEPSEMEIYVFDHLYIEITTQCSYCWIKLISFPEIMQWNLIVVEYYYCDPSKKLRLTHRSKNDHFGVTFCSTYSYVCAWFKVELLKLVTITL